MFTFALLPLLLLTFSGVLTFYAQQGLTLAAADGARAALRYPADASTTARIHTAEAVAANRMDWLLSATGNSAAKAIKAGEITCPVPAQDTDFQGTDFTCIRVTTNTLCPKPYTAFCWWMLVKNMKNQATVQVPLNG